MSETTTLSPSQSPSQATVSLPASALVDHPILAHIPVWARSEPDFQALLDSIAERGQDYEVLIDSQQRVVDGRNRRNALGLLGREVRCRHVADAEAASIALSSLANRRHLTQGARAYLTAPLLQPAVEEARERRMGNLRAGFESPDSPLSRLSGKNAEDMAASLGFSRALFFQALDLHKRFAAHPELRAQFEPKVLSGELGLGSAIQAIAGKLSTEGKAKKTAPVDALLARALKSLRTRFSTGWEKLDDERKAQVTTAVATSTTDWPDEVVAATAKQWRQAGRI